MREEINRNLVVGGVKVSRAIEQVEAEVANWKCDQYMHITRAMEVTDNPHDGQIIHLETLFSKPTQDRPVPIAVVCVFFTLNCASGTLTYQFEQECVKHEVGGQSLASGKFQMWLDRIIGDKMQVRQLQDLKTPFEETRLAPPPLPSEQASEEEGEKSPTEGEQSPASSGGMAAEGASPKDSPKAKAEDGKLPLSVLLANIFDAADEEDEYELTHKEVADLLYATPLGLADWDIKLLMTTATERPTGKIEWKPFVQSAPEIIEALRRRRASFIDRKVNAQKVNLDAIELCYGEEIEDVCRAAREAFTAQDSAGKGTLSRYEFKTCLRSKSDRFSSQEVAMLMQMCKEDEYGQVAYDDFNILLQTLRIDALHNALVETDIMALRIHLILLLRREGMIDQRVFPIWSLRRVLLSADQLCLSRMQIHVILCILHPNELGEVDVEYFLRVCCTVIPNMFDTFAFMEKAGQIARDKADAQAKQEEEELKGITSSLAAKRRSEDEEQEDEKANAPDRDAVEKALIHLGNSIYDDRNRQHQSIDVAKFLEAMQHETVQQCQFSEAELRGFIAEAEIDEKREIHFNDHVKAWVRIIFELRKSRVYDTILSQDWGLHAIHLTDLSYYDTKFPVHIGDSTGTPRSTTGGSQRREGRKATRQNTGSFRAGRRNTGRFSRKGTAAAEECADIARQLSSRRRSTARKETLRGAIGLIQSSGRFKLRTRDRYENDSDEESAASRPSTSHSQYG